MSKTVLITRPKEDEAELSAKIRKLGYKVISEPLLIIKPKHEDINERLQQYHDAVLIITSANALRTFASLTELRHFEVLTIGKASLQEAKNLGFENSSSILDSGKYAEGNIENMLSYIFETYKKSSEFLYVAGTSITYNVTAVLNDVGYKAEMLQLYDAHKVNGFCDETLQILKQGRVDVVLFYSKRTAEVFDELCKKYGLKQSLHGLQIITLSQKITNLLIEKGWSNIITADLPDEDSIIKELKLMTDKIENAHTTNTKPRKGLCRLLPVVFIIIAAVLIFQNVLLSKKIDAISANIQESVTQSVSNYAAKVQKLDERIGALGNLDTSSLKDNNKQLEDIKTLLQDIRGLSFDGPISPKDIIIEHTVPVAPSASAEYSVVEPAPASPTKALAKINVDEHIAELEKIESQLASYETAQKTLRKLVFETSELVISEHNSNLGKTTEIEEKSLISGFVKVRKIQETPADDFVESIKAAVTAFENDDITESKAIFDQINLEAKNDRIAVLSGKLREFQEQQTSPEQLLSKLSTVAKAIKLELSK